MITHGVLVLLCVAPRDYNAMCKDYYTLQFMDPSIDTSPIAPALQVSLMMPASSRVCSRQCCLCNAEMS